MESLARDAIKNSQQSMRELLPTRPLLTLEELAHLLDRSPKGLQETIYGSTELGRALRAIRVKLGKRVYFRRDRLEQLIDAATGTA